MFYVVTVTMTTSLGSMDFRKILIVGSVFLLIISGYFALADQETGSTCEEDLAATGQYAIILKEQRDRLEIEVARLKYWKDFLERRNKQIETKLLDLDSKGNKK